MVLKNSVIELIKRRISVRTYSGKPIDSLKKAVIRKFLSDLPEPVFDTKLRFQFLTGLENDEKDLKGLVTYGMIKRPAGFIVGSSEFGEKYHEDFGYIMEHIVLFAVDLGLGTCWLGGTFKKSRFAQIVKAHENETVPAVISLGVPAERRRLIDSAVVSAIRARHRLPPAQLFFDGGFGRILDPRKSALYAQPLEMVRLGPSASNKQPWRIIYSKEDKRFHFYLSRHKSYERRWNRNSNRKLVSAMADLQKIDMGIAMCHFELTAREMKLKGRWEFKNPEMDLPSSSFEYIVSWQIE